MKRKRRARCSEVLESNVYIISMLSFSIKSNYCTFSCTRNFFGRTMSFDLQEAQRTSIVKMLDLKSASDATDQKHGFMAVPQWKVLIYDRACQDVIAPILKV